MSQTAAELDESIEAITVDCYGDDEELGAFLQAFEDELELPMNASVVGVPVEVVAMEYGGDVRRGIVARCRREGEDYEVSLADVVLAEPASAAALHAAFRRWLGLSRPGCHRGGDERGATPERSPLAERGRAGSGARRAAREASRVAGSCRSPRR